MARPFVIPSAVLSLALMLAGSALAQSDPGRILWRFEMASSISGDEVAVGADGTIYASDNTQLYALHHDGTVKWTRAGVGAGTPVSFLADGTIIVGLGETVYALDPADGSDVWTFSYDSNNFHEQIEVGPSVGPDGNIYGVTSTDGTYGLGAFSLTPDGQLRWNDEGQPVLSKINAGTGGPVYFTSDRLIFPFRTVQNGANVVYGYDFGGKQTLYVDFTCTGPPRTDPLNRLLITSGCGVEALQEDGNQSFWTVDFGSVNLAPAIGADATVYSGDWLGAVNAVNPDGTIAWTSADASNAARMLAVRQDVGVLVYSGGNFGTPDFVSGVQTSDGALAWTVDLTTVNGNNELVWTIRAATSLDGSTAYFTTRFTSNGAPGALYAVDIDGAGQSPVGVPDVAAAGVDGPRVTAAPNPFRSRTELSYSLDAPGRVRIDVFDVTGRLVRTLENGERAAGAHVAGWDGRDASGARMKSGVYFYRFLAGGGEKRGKLVLTR